MDMLHDFSVSQDYARDLLTAEDHHNLSHLQGHGAPSGHNLSHLPVGHNLSPPGHNLSPGTGHNLSSASAHNLSPTAPAHNLSTHNLSEPHSDWQSPTYSYTTSTPEDSPGVDDLSIGYEFDLVSPTYVTPTLSALISPVRGGFYKQNVTQSVGSLPSGHGSGHVMDHVTNHVTHSDHVTSSDHVSDHMPSSNHVTNHVPYSTNLFESKPSPHSSYGSRSNSTGHISLYNHVTPTPASTLYSQASYSTPSLTDFITFEYSKNRTKTQYKILSHIHTVNTSDLSAEFKKENCIYPRAAVPKEEYQGNRHQYETECNHIGWSLAHLNPSIRKKRGVIQRAVDSWRNTNPNPKFRSRRVRKLSKKTQQAAQAAAQQQHQQMMQQQRGVYVPYDYYR